MRAASASDSSPFRKAATSSGEGGPPRRSRSAAMKSLAAAFQSAFVFIVDYLFPVDVAPFGADDRLQLVARVAEARADRLVREAGRRGDLLGGRAAQAEEEAEARGFGERGQVLPAARAEEVLSRTSPTTSSDAVFSLSRRCAFSSRQRFRARFVAVVRRYPQRDLPW